MRCNYLEEGWTRGIKRQKNLSERLKKLKTTTTTTTTRKTAPQPVWNNNAGSSQILVGALSCHGTFFSTSLNFFMIFAFWKRCPTMMWNKSLSVCHWLGVLSFNAFCKSSLLLITFSPFDFSAPIVYVGKKNRTKGIKCWQKVSLPYAFVWSCLLFSPRHVWLSQTRVVRNWIGFVPCSSVRFDFHMTNRCCDWLLR